MPVATSGAAPHTISERSAEGTVRAFLSALEQLDFDATMALAAPNIRWVNAPLTSARDKAGFGRACRGMFKMVTRFEVEFLDIHERGEGIVYTDRIDTIEGGGLRMKIGVQGEFRVENGLVVDWVDRFSWPHAIGDILRSLPAIVISRLRG
ncbi:MAG: limonene-1,2-epoxide hydrolase family protein [Polyangiales bacterium]